VVDGAGDTGVVGCWVGCADVHTPLDPGRPRKDPGSDRSVTSARSGPHRIHRAGHEDHRPRTYTHTRSNTTSAARTFPAQTPLLRDVEVTADPLPHTPQVSPLLDEVPDHPAEPREVVAVDGVPGLGPSELVREQFMEFRQSHATIVPTHH